MLQTPLGAMKERALTAGALIPPDRAPVAQACLSRGGCNEGRDGANGLGEEQGSEQPGPTEQGRLLSLGSTSFEES